MNRIRAGIIGCGGITWSKHIPAFKKIRKQVDLVSVCDKNEDLARKTAEQFRIPHSYSNLSEMLSRERISLLDICVPPAVHSTIALEGIDNGCHILMEKPMALSVSECDKMIEGARAKGVKLCVIHNDLFHPPFIKARELVRNGSIGEFVGMRIYLSTPHDDMIDIENHWYHRLPGGVIGETGPHVAYMALAFIKNIKNVDINASSRLNLSWAKHDDFWIGIEGENGFCSAGLSYSRNTWEATVDIFGTDASLHIDLEQMLVIRKRLEQLRYGSIASLSIGTIFQMICGLSTNAIKTILGTQRIGTDAIIEAFVNSIMRNTDPPVTGEDGRETVRLMERIVTKYKEKYPM
jgi:predicted dehydrogenase